MTSIRAIEQRVRKKLREEGRGRFFYKVRGDAEKQALGEYCLADADFDTVFQPHVDLVMLAKELGVLKEGEKTEQPEWSGSQYRPQ